MRYPQPYFSMSRRDVLVWLTKNTVAFTQFGILLFVRVISASRRIAAKERAVEFTRCIFLVFFASSLIAIIDM